MKKVFPLILLFIGCNTQSQGGCGNGYIELDGNCYHEGDLRILQKLIDNSNGTINTSLDIDNNGSIEPLELKYQKWNEQGRLHFLWLYDRNLSGSIPDSIGELTYLDTLNLSYNSISGKIPESIGNLSNLNWLYLYSNQLSGSISDTICALYPNLDHFWIEYNQFCPPYPDCVPMTEIGVQDTSNCN